MRKKVILPLSLMSVLLFVLAFLVALLAPVPDVNVQAQPTAWSADGNWELKREDGVTVYKVKDGASLDALPMLTYNGRANFTSFSYDLRFDKLTDDGGANVGLQLVFPDTTQYWHLDNNTSDKIARMRIFAPGQNGDVFASSQAPVVDTTVGKWMNVRVTYENYILKYYIDDVQAYELNMSTFAALNDMMPRISAWRTYVSVKNLTFNGVTEQPNEWQATEAWTEQDGVYTTNGALGTITYLPANGGTYNTFSTQFKVNSVLGDGADGNFSVRVYLGTQSWLFEYNPAAGRKYVRLRWFESDAGEGVELCKKNIETGELGSAWHTLKVVFAENYLAMFVDDVRELVHYDTMGKDMSAATVSISAWNVAAEAKEFALSLTQPDFSDMSYLDLEFNDARGVLSMGAQNAALTYEAGTLKAQVAGGAPVLTSPVIDVPKGSKYSVKLPVRNTFVVRMKNDTAAETLTLSFITAEDGEYDAQKQKSFPIEPNSGWTTYYFNLSDVLACDCHRSNDALKSCNAYLRGFRLALDGVSEGSFSIDEISFAREDAIEQFAALSLTATADEAKGTVTVTGTLRPEYADQVVTILHTEVMNYGEALDYKNNKEVGQAVAQGTNFTVTFPLKRGDKQDMTHLSSKFLACVGSGSNFRTETKLSGMFMIENWRDFSENPYAFTLPELSVSVTDAQFGAKGDGFTNDTNAIQAAIDYVSQQGGGTVVVPGDTSEYGRRYIMTGVELKSNVELRIEKGAVLEQSHHAADYTKYQIYMGHENMGGDVAWGISALMHLPFLYLHNATNVRVTGGGTIRMDDTGTEWLDGNGYAWDSNITLGCSSIIHLVPIGIYGCTNVEVSDLTIMRASNWHVVIRETSRAYFGNIDMTQVNDINGDGLDFFNNTHDIVVDRCSLYSNDAIVLDVTMSDPRDTASIWSKLSDAEDQSVYNFTIRRSNLFGGHGITLIPWASDYRDQEKVRIHHIDVRDCVLGGSSTAVGAWADNPFYGTSNFQDGTYGSTDAVEEGDYSPVQDLTILNNDYVAPCSFYGMNVTNALTDFPMVASPDFENGNFDKGIHKGTTGRYNDESTYVTGLSYWSGEGDVGTQKMGTKDSAAVDTGAPLVQDDYAGFIKGEGELYQGLYKPFGAYDFKIKVKLVSGTATMFARDGATGTLIKEQALTTGDTFTEQTLSFTLEKGTLVQLGIRHAGGAEEIVYLDDATIALDPNANVYDVPGEETVQDFGGEEFDFTVKPNASGVTVSNGTLTTGADAEYKIMLNNKGALDTFQVEVDILNADGNVNAGLYLFASNANAGQDDITAYNVQVEKAEGADSYVVTLFRFEGKFAGSLAKSSPIPLSGARVAGGSIHLRVVCKVNTIFVFVDGGTQPVLTYEVPAGTSGNVGLRAQMVQTTFDNFSLKTEQFVLAGGDKSALNAILAEGNRYAEYGYTAESYAALQQAIAQANALPEEARQSEIDACARALQQAIENLQPRDGLQQAKDALTAAVNMAKKFAQADYTQESFEALTSAIAAAESAVQAPDATVASVEEAKQALERAASGLVSVARADELQQAKDALTAAVNMAKKFAQADYTQESFEALTSAIAAAESAVQAPDATVASVEAAKQALERAASGLVSVARADELQQAKDALTAAVNMAKKFAQADYTQESFEALTSAIAAAESAMQAPDATVASVEEAKQALEKAASGLVHAAPAQQTPPPEADGGSDWVLPFVLCLVGLAVGCGATFLTLRLISKKKK